MKLLILGTLAAALLVTACNSNLRGTTVSPLEGNAWVQPDAKTQPTSGELTLVEFFAPT